MAITDTIANVVDSVKAKVGLPNATTDSPVVPEDPKQAVGFLEDLVKDAEDYRAQHYFNRLGYQDGNQPAAAMDPILFWSYCHLLEQGDHWRVWGTRKRDKGAADDWKAELVENEIGNQIRVQTAYLTANFHGFVVTPNIANINDIIRQDQKKTQWSSKIIEVAKRMGKYGSVILRSYMDFDLDPRGIASEFICDNAGILVSPFTTGISRSKGCWYIAYRSYQPIWRIQQLYGESMKNLGVDISQIQGISVDKQAMSDKASTRLLPIQTYNFKRSKSTEHIEFFMDDFSEEDAVFSEDEFGSSLQSMAQGVAPPINEHMNHKAMVENYLREMSNKNALASDPSTTLQDHADLDQWNQLAANQIQRHLGYRMDGKRPKNPNGRKIVLAGGKVVLDVPNPYHFDWRRLYTWINFESIDGQLWGRGLAEILWATNKSLDLMKSRIADMGLWSIPEIWLSQENKSFFSGKDKYRKDPSAIKYYVGSPPVSPQSRSPMEFVQMFKMDKEAAARAYAINSTTYGEDTGTDLSGKAMDILSNQNSILVTGQPNVNLAEGVEQIIETRLQMMKQFYTEDRMYLLKGSYVDVNVSQILTEQQAVEGGKPLRNPDGSPIMRPIPDIEVSIKPDSNLPNAWEEDISTLVKISAAVPANPNEPPLIPREAIYDRLAERYPDFGAGGEYRTVTQATQIGMQVMAQQEALRQQQEEEQQMLADVAKRRLSTEIKKRITPAPTNGNGQE